MEKDEGVAQQKHKDTRDKNIQQRKWPSEPVAGFSDKNGKNPLDLEHSHGKMSSRMSGTQQHQKHHHHHHHHHPVKPLSAPVSLSSHLARQPHQVNPASNKPHSHPSPQTRMQDAAAPRSDAQAGPGCHPWPHPHPPTGGSSLDHPHGSAGAYQAQNPPYPPTGCMQYSPQGSLEQHEETQKKDLKPKKPGKYVCHFCGRACAKPSVLKKHIRSHTGERPYPCGPCGFSFKTKSNLYKHRKSHAHAIKAGLAPSSDQAATHADLDHTSPARDLDTHSDGDQSTDTEDETTEGTCIPDKQRPIPEVSFESGPRPAQGLRQQSYMDPNYDVSMVSKQVPLLVISQQGYPSAAMEFGISKGRQGDETAVKSGIASRQAEINVQESEQSVNLLSPRSKGSTDSGYFSRSESADQQVSPPNTNIKSYEEIMFGRTWYSRPNSRPRQPTVAGMGRNAVSMNDADIMLTDRMKSPERSVLRGGISDSQTDPQREKNRGYATGPRPNAGLLEALTDTGPLMRCNSMPTPSQTTLNVPTGIRGSHSFDERITPDEVFNSSVSGSRRLTRQPAFEHSGNESHIEPGHCGTVTAQSMIQPLKNWNQGYSSDSVRTKAQEGVDVEVERTFFTRKRRMKKSVGDEEDSGHIEMNQADCVEMIEDREASRSPSARGGAIWGSRSHSGSFDSLSRVSTEELASDPDRKSTGHVISVIQHTNSLSRPSSFERCESADLPSYPGTPSRQLSEHSDADNVDNEASSGLSIRSDSVEQQQLSDCELAGRSPNPYFSMPSKLVRQSNIQVPEIRVTVEPDKPEKEPEPAAKEQEKQQVEEFQWPQRSETLSQLPEGKLPPKKKRLRLADMEHSSGESSFESTCTSLSRSPSQDSNLSHGSSFSMSFEKEEYAKAMSPTRLDDSYKPPEFLMVPGCGHSLSIPGPGHPHREMRRSSSEQAPYTLPTQTPDIRSKSFDCGSLANPSRQGELYASPTSLKERRRGYLVRQASLSVYPETVLQDPSGNTCIKQEHVETVPLSGGNDHCSFPGTCRRANTSEEAKSKPSSKPSDHERFSKDTGSQEEEMYWTSLTQRRHFSNPSQQHSPSQSKRHSDETQTRCSPTPHQRQVDLVTQRIHQDHPPSQNDPRGHIVMQSAHVMLPALHASSPVTPAMQVPVRGHTHMPSYTSVTYTSVSEISTTHTKMLNSRPMSIDKTLPTPLTTSSPYGTSPSISHVFGHVDVSVHYSAVKIQDTAGRLRTGIPLPMTTTFGTISATDSLSGVGMTSKRQPSPSSPVDLIIQTTQQRRAKEERMFGQMVEDLGAVELSSTGMSEHKRKSVDPSADDDDGGGGKVETMCVPAQTSSIRQPGPDAMVSAIPSQEPSTSALSMVADGQDEGTDPLDVDIPSPDSCSPKALLLSPHSDIMDSEDTTNRKPVNMLIQLASNQSGGTPASTLLLTDLQDHKQLRHFPTLRTATNVSWCFLNYTKPTHFPTNPDRSVYASWCVNSFNPNPCNLTTKATLALFCSRQRKSTDVYTTATEQLLASGKLVTSTMWKQRMSQLKPEEMQLDPVPSSHPRGRSYESEAYSGEEAEILRPNSKQAEPTRIKIFEGGYKSNEDYVYVRGRGRGKYICEECGIRCKKPSMLKKHIRTHTDVRPYVCRYCNFAFKTKGNLTKHMKSKAHLKKCLELGVSVTGMDECGGDEADAEEIVGDSGKYGMATHQFSDAEDSEGPDEDEVEEDEEDEDEYDGDSTPRTSSRSTSPQPLPPSKILPAATGGAVASHGSIADFFLSAPRLPFSYLPSQLPSIQVTRLVGGDLVEERVVGGDLVKERVVGRDLIVEQVYAKDNLLSGHFPEKSRNQLSVPSAMDEDLSLSGEECMSSAFDTPHSSRLSSPTFDTPPRRDPPSSSSTAQRHYSPRGDLSPRRRLSPRRELYHLRPVSPRGDARHRDASPRGDCFSTPHSLATSPGRELVSGRRDLSPRSPYRVRPVSPRRGRCTHHQGSSAWSAKTHPQEEVASLAQKLRAPPDTNTERMRSWQVDNLIDVGVETGIPSCSLGLYSHLPLHSQQPIPSTFPMIPLGGIQIVRSLQPSSISPAHHSSQANGRSAEEVTPTPEKFVSSDSRKSPSATFVVRSHQQQHQGGANTHVENVEKGKEVVEGPIRQEESIQKCTKAIASLQIATE